MEQEMNQEPQAQTETVDTTVEAVETKKKCVLKDMLCEKFGQLKQGVTIGDIILFAGAFTALPLIDFAAKNIQSQALSMAFFAILPFVFFGLGFWFSKDGIRPISSFLHSFAAISLLMAVIALIPQATFLTNILTGSGTVALGMVILVVAFLFVTSYIRNVGSSYLFGAVGGILLFLFSMAQFVGIPCNQAIMANSANAAQICAATPYVQNILIPAVLFVIGFFTLQPKKVA